MSFAHIATIALLSTAAVPTAPSSVKEQQLQVEKLQSNTQERQHSCCEGMRNCRESHDRTPAADAQDAILSNGA
jgi:hypothetical protein